MRHFLCLICIHLFISTSAQTIEDVQLDTLNKFYQSKKTGYWIQYLNHNLTKVVSKEKASFFEFVYYDSGIYLGPRYGTGPVGSKRTSVVFDSISPVKGKIIMLHGRFRLYAGHKWLYVEVIYNKGIMSRSVAYGRRGHITEDVDFTARYNNQPGSYQAVVYPGPKTKLLIVSKKVNGRWTRTVTVKRKRKGKWES